MGIIWPYPTKEASMWRRIDQGQDLQVAVGTPIYAIASGTISVAHDPNGFGDPYPILTFDSPQDGNPACYYGHNHPEVPVGAHVTQGQTICHALQVPGGNASGDPGWLELGWWNNGPTGNGQSMHDALVAAPVFGGSGPHGWASLGGAINEAPAVARNSDGRLEVFARGTDNSLRHVWQNSPEGGWSDWASLGGSLTSELAAAANSDGRLELFARSTDNALWHIWQDSAGGGWSKWASLGGGITGAAAVGRNSDGRLEAFARGTDGALWHIWQDSAGGGWSKWSSLGG